VVSPVYPDDSLQSTVKAWWIIDEAKGEDALRPGRLMQAFAPFIDHQLLEITGEGRANPTDHTRAIVRIAPMNLNEAPPETRLPLAGMPALPNERRAVVRGKRRPVIVLARKSAEVSEEFRRNKSAKWHTIPTVLVAPFYGVAQTDNRAGWPKPFVERIRHLHYSQYFWDVLPMKDENTVEGSILRLDQAFSISTHHTSFVWTKHVLSEEAQLLIDTLVDWQRRGTLPDGHFAAARQLFMSLDETA
jgi:hypothetical protein